MHFQHTIDACKFVRSMCSAMDAINESNMWNDGRFDKIRAKTFEALEAAINHFYKNGVALFDLEQAIIIAGWNHNRLELNAVTDVIKIVGIPDKTRS